MIENDRVAEFQDAEPKKKAEYERADIDCGEFFSGRHCRKFVCNQLEMQFQQADFQGERFLNVSVQQALRFFERSQVFEGLPGRDFTRQGARA